MKGDKNIILHLNKLLSDELVAVNQYFLHSKLFKSWGLERLNNIEHTECMEELEHAGLYADRILFLEGIPVIKNCDSANIKENIEDVLRMDLRLEYNAIVNLREGIRCADSIEDYISKEIMINILHAEEKHVDFLETELGLILKLGIHNYIQSQLKK
ncbi:bacterioferritin [Candidatus Blochmanniella floridana]|uniref:Bacterioferritin n=1 Tax=Blochmanniella floridana TaxID=203907 RepID=Q7VQF0_BLOFL|nr:bacterioferritin [Candidatus Blochmannia floridanus]